MIRTTLVSLIALSSLTAFAEKRSLQGSDTMAGFMSDAVVASALEDQLVYQGGGSGKGEEALANGQQGFAPMSRAFKAEALTKAQGKGINVIEHVVGLDGIALFVNGQLPVAKLTLDQVKKIFTCEVTDWSAVGGPSAKIEVYRRDDFSGTTDTFKNLVGVKDFGACVTVVKETSDIAVKTSEKAYAIGYAGLSGLRPENKDLALAKDAASEAFSPTPANIRSFKYPLARKLFVYEASGSVTPSAAERTLLNNILDRSFADPILVNHEFLTLD